jgi:hypothetical protein
VTERQKETLSFRSDHSYGTPLTPAHVGTKPTTRMQRPYRSTRLDNQKNRTDEREDRISFKTVYHSREESKRPYRSNQLDSTTKRTATSRSSERPYIVRDKKDEKKRSPSKETKGSTERTRAVRLLLTRSSIVNRQSSIVEEEVEVEVEIVNRRERIFDSRSSPEARS